MRFVQIIFFQFPLFTSYTLSSMLLALSWSLMSKSFNKNNTLVQAFSSLPIYYDASNHLHRDIQYHPEQPLRITACVKALERLQEKLLVNNDSPKIELINVANADYTGSPLVDTCKNEPFSKEDLDHALDVLLQVHDNDLVLKLKERCHLSRQRRIAEDKDPLGHVGYIDADTYVTTESFDVSLRGVAAWIRAVTYSLQSRRRQTRENVQVETLPTTIPAVALMRPPGHHATFDQQNGFCLFNLAAAAAVHALNDPSQSCQKVSILDWDVHYGQGVADIVKKYENLRYVSIHQAPAFPYMGEKNEIISCEYDNVMTIPVPPDTTWTCGYKEHYQQALNFVYQRGDWEPDLVIVCAGYDALDSDELASCSLISEDYHTMTCRLIDHLREQGQAEGEEDSNSMPALMIGLEGGYQLADDAAGGNMPQAVVATVEALIEKTTIKSHAELDVSEQSEVERSEVERSEVERSKVEQAEVERSEVEKSEVEQR